MRQITIEQLKVRVGGELKELPFEITRRGKVIAVVLSPTEVQSYEQTIVDEVEKPVEGDDLRPAWYKLGCERAKTKFFKSKKAKLEPFEIV